MAITTSTVFDKVRLYEGSVGDGAVIIHIELRNSDTRAPSGSYATLDAMKNGTTWRTPNLHNGAWIAVSDSDSHNWPASYTFAESHRNEFTRLLASTRVL